MNEEGREFPRESVSRRSVLKGMGAGAAIAWSAPVLQSLSSPAHAQAYGCGPTCADVFCLPPAEQCGEGGPFGLCLCSQTAEGDCFCAEDRGCGGIETCGESEECGPGQRCMEVCGCGGGSFCLDECGTTQAARRSVAQGDAGRASGR